MASCCLVSPTFQLVIARIICAYRFLNFSPFNKHSSHLFQHLKHGMVITTSDEVLIYCSMLCYTILHCTIINYTVAVDESSQ